MCRFRRLLPQSASPREGTLDLKTAGIDTGKSSGRRFMMAVDSPPRLLPYLDEAFISLDSNSWISAHPSPIFMIRANEGSIRSNVLLMCGGVKGWILFRDLGTDRGVPADGQSDN